MRSILKPIMTGLLAAACMLAFTNCQREETQKQPQREQLVLWHYWDIPKNQQHLEELVKDFNASQEETEIKVRYIPDEDFKKQLALAMAEGTMPDIALVDSSDFQFLHHMQPFAELTGQIPELENYLPQALSACTVDGKIYGQPFGVNCTGMFYNKKLLEKAGCQVPTDWEEFRETAGKTSTKGVSGFAITALPTEESMYEFLPLLWSMGGDVHSINSAASAGAFSFLDGMEQEGSLSRQSISLTMGDLTNQFIQGKIAMMFNSSMAIDSIQEDAPNLEFGVAPIPCGDNPVTVAGGEILAVAEAPHKEAAFQFLKFLSEPKRMQSYIDAFGFLAPRQDIMEQQFQEEPLKQAFIGMYQDARVRETSTAWPRISLTLADTLRQVLLLEAKTQEILDETAGKIAEIGEETP